MWRVVLSLVLAACVGTYAYAKERGGNKAPKAPQSLEDQFKSLDKNNDGKLSCEEFTARMKKPEQKEKAEQQFKAAVKSTDGLMTLDEFKAMREKKPGKRRK